MNATSSTSVLIGALFASTLLPCLSSCSDTAPQAPPVPPPLVIESMAVSAGDLVELQSAIESPALQLGCGPDWLTLTVGPSDNDYALGDWELRARGNCGTDRSCGFLYATVQGADATVELLSARRYVEIATEELPAGDILTFRVELRGDDGEPLQLEGETVADEVTVELQRAPDCPGGAVTGE